MRLSYPICHDAADNESRNQVREQALVLFDFLDAAYELSRVVSVLLCNSGGGESQDDDRLLCRQNIHAPFYGRAVDLASSALAVMRHTVVGVCFTLVGRL